MPLSALISNIGFGRLFQEERPVWHIINCNALPKDYKETKAEEAHLKNKQITMFPDIEYPSNHASEQQVA